MSNLSSRRRPGASARAARSVFWMLLALAVCAGQAGCVTRRLTIRSNPPGALVYVDDYQVGTTPCSTEFVYYGTRKIRLVLSGYETLTVLQPIPTPWYQYFGLDFISENLVPGEIRDERVVDLQLRPQMIKPTQQLLASAEDLRRSVAPPKTPIMPGLPPYATSPLGPGANVLAPPTSQPGLPVSPPPASRPGGLFNY